MILVVSYPDDPHAQVVIGHLQEDGADPVLLDVSDLPERATITVDYTRQHRPVLEVRRDGDGAMDVGGARSVWWRRPQVADLSMIGDPDARLFAQNEWHEAINGLWQLIEAPWMNPPHLDERASHKAYQLRVAAEVGLAIPHTLITSDPFRAQAFVEACGPGRAVFKTFSATHAIWRETRVVGEAELAALDALRLAPVIFQEHVPGIDLRVTVVGERIFPAAIDTAGTDYPVDFRMSLGQADTQATDLPTEVEKLLGRLMTRLGLVYGAVDMRRTPEGRYVFLEVNTAGEFLFIEERTAQPIARAVAEWLARPSAP